MSLRCRDCDEPAASYRVARELGWARGQTSVRCPDCRRDRLDEPTIRVYVNLPESMVEMLDMVGRPRSELIRAAVADYLSGALVGDGTDEYEDLVRRGVFGWSR